jgi:hypothetical protein
MNAIQYLVKAIATQVIDPPRRWEIEPPELSRDAYAEALEQMKLQSDSPERPQLHRFFADNYVLILADLGPDWKLAREVWLLAQAEVAFLRALMGPGRNEDFMLMLVTYAGADRDPEWIALAAEIERNDRVCRKLVWLPPATAEKANESARVFLGRSFLARPWLHDSPETLTALDAARNPSKLLGDWETILDQNLLREPDYIGLIRALIEKEVK